MNQVLTSGASLSHGVQSGIAIFWCFSASFLGSLCTELVRDWHAEGLEVVGADFCACVQACFTPHAGLPHLHFAPAFAAPLKAGNVGLDDNAVCGQVDVLFHVASPMVG